MPDKKTGIDAIATAQLRQAVLLKCPKDMTQLSLFAMYLLTAQVGYYPGDWPKDRELLELIKLPYIERVAYVGALMAAEWERVRDKGGFVHPPAGI